MWNAGVRESPTMAPREKNDTRGDRAEVLDGRNKPRENNACIERGEPRHFSIIHNALSKEKGLLGD